jgi:hypothetical protein
MIIVGVIAAVDALDPQWLLLYGYPVSNTPNQNRAFAAAIPAQGRVSADGMEALPQYTFGIG